MVKRFIRYRHSLAHQEALVDEIDNLNNDIVKLKSENQKYLER